MKGHRHHTGSFLDLTIVVTLVLKVDTCRLAIAIQSHARDIVVPSLSLSVLLVSILNSTHSKKNTCTTVLVLVYRSSYFMFKITPSVFPAVNHHL